MTDISTHDRLLDAAVDSFGTKGYDATSLDQLAGELGVRKQTILYYHPSKAALLDAVIDRAAEELAEALEEAAATSGGGFDRIEAIVRSVFRLAVRRPELLGLLREVTRLGPPATNRIMDIFEPMIVRATGFLEEEMDAGHLRRCDARLLLVSVYSTIVGAATEVEVLKAVGVEPSLKSAAQRRREVIEFLRAALIPDNGVG